MAWQVMAASLAVHQAIGRAGIDSLPLVHRANEAGELPWEIVQELKHGVRNGRSILIIGTWHRGAGVEETADLLKRACIRDFAIAICDFRNSAEGAEILRALDMLKFEQALRCRQIWADLPALRT